MWQQLFSEFDLYTDTIVMKEHSSHRLFIQYLIMQHNIMQGGNALIVFMDKLLLKCFPATVPDHIPTLDITNKYITCYYFVLQYNTQILQYIFNTKTWILY